MSDSDILNAIVQGLKLLTELAKIALHYIRYKLPIRK